MTEPPALIAGLSGEIDGVPSAGFTVSMPVWIEFATSSAESVTITLKYTVFPASDEGSVYAHVPLVVRKFPTCAPVTLLKARKLYVYGDSPPVTLAVRVICWPASSAAGSCSEGVMDTDGRATSL